MPNRLAVPFLVVEIDKGGVGHSHSNRTTSKSGPHDCMICIKELVKVLILVVDFEADNPNFDS